jgi:hypothetical protein
MNSTYTKPTSIPFTNRQSLTSKDGIALERQYLYAPAVTWDALRKLCHAQGRSGSEVFQSLINIASTGLQKDTNDTINRKN